MSETLFLVDGSGFIHRAFHALPPLTTRAGEPSGALFGFASMLIRLENDHHPTHLACVLDAGISVARREKFPAYKANRTPARPELVTQLRRAPEIVKAFGVPLFAVPDVEADDVIATLARRALDGGMKVVIVSSDKDLMQLVSSELSLVDTMKNVRFGPAEVEAKFGVPPERLGDVLALMGDAVDNVPGVPGIGPKTASALIQQAGSLENLYAHLDTIVAPGTMRGADRVRALLAEHRDAVKLSRELVTLEEHLPLEGTLEDLRRRPPDRDTMEKTLRALEFDRLLERMRFPSTPTAALPAPAPAQLSMDMLARPASAQVSAPAPTTLVESAVALPDAPPRIVTTTEALTTLIADLSSAEEIAIALECDEAPPRRATLIGIAFAADGIAPAYLPFAHRYLGAPAQLAIADTLAALGPLLAARSPKKRVHRSKDARLALATCGLSLDGVIGDPELGSYLLDPNADSELSAIAARHALTVDGRTQLCGTGRKATPFEEIEIERAAIYSTHRAQATLALDRALAIAVEKSGMGNLLDDVELPLARVLAVMERHGVRVDTSRLASLGAEMQESLDRLQARVNALAGYELNLLSVQQLQHLLFEKLGLPPQRRTKTGLSVDAEVLEELAPLNPIIEPILEYRLLSKLKGTYVDALPRLIDVRTGRVHTSFNQVDTATGRLSSSDPNLQNIPIRSELGMKIRAAFIADDGNLLVAADYSQIELRVVAHLSKDPLLVDSFTKRQDVHARTASEVFGVPAESVTREQRTIAKAINYGLAYGQGDYGLSRVLGIHRAEAAKYIASYMLRYAGVARFMHSLISEAQHQGGARTLLGRWRALPDLEARNRNARNAAERMARNTPIQGAAADLMKLAMIRVEERLEKDFPSARMLLTVHDELVVEAPSAECESLAAMLKHVMENVYPLDVPLEVDVGVGSDWSAC